MTTLLWCAFWLRKPEWGHSPDRTGFQKRPAEPGRPCRDAVKRVRVSARPAHFNPALRAPYRHLHTLPEASAACSGTEGLTKMLFLCYGWNPETKTRNMFEKKREKAQTKEGCTLLNTGSSTNQSSFPTANPDQKRAWVWHHKMAQEKSYLGRLFTYLRYNHSITES